MVPAACIVRLTGYAADWPLMVWRGEAVEVSAAGLYLRFNLRVFLTRAERSGWVLISMFLLSTFEKSLRPRNIYTSFEICGAISLTFLS